MKNIYTLLFMSCLGFTTTAQMQMAGKGVSLPLGKVEKTNVVFDKAEIWSDDFSTPSNWVLTNSSTPALNWSFSTNTSGSPVAALNPIGFASVSNGYVIINSDAEGPAATQNARIETAGSIDLTGHEYVNLRFSSIYRTFEDKRTVYVSGNNGVTWDTIVITTGANSEANVNSANPTVHVFNISEVAGNKSQVKIAFEYQASYGWFWAIDDVAIEPTDEFDLLAVSTTFGTDGPFGARLPYSMVPTTQVQPIYFSATVKNNGYSNISDAKVTATVPSASYSSSATASINAGVTTTIDLPQTYTPAATVGVKTVNIAVSTDAHEEDNVTNNNFPAINIDVNNSIYARDMNGSDGGLYNQGIGYEMGNVYDIFSDAMVYGIDVHIASTTDLGSYVFAKIYSVEDDFMYMTETLAHQVTSSDLGQIITLAFMEPQQLSANSTYLAVAGSYGTGGVGNDLVLISSGKSEDQTSFLYDEGDATWYFIRDTPKVRLNFDASLSTDKLGELAGVAIYPNPSKGIVNITNDKNISQIITVTDLTGKVVLTKEVSAATTVDLSLNGAGVYFVTVSNTTGSKVEKVIIK